MRNKVILAIAFIVSIPLGLLAQDEGFYPYSFARLSYVKGAVYVQRTSDLGYEKGEVNLALVQGDKMGTEDGQAEVHFGRRNYLRLDANTKVEFAVLPKEGDDRLKIHILEGSAYLRVSSLAVDKGIEVHTPDASFYVLEEGLYRFNVALDRETTVFVHEGSLEAAAEDGSVLVRDKETVAAADGRLLGDPEYSYARQDGFDDWNGTRDAQLAQRSERQYLPSGLEEYEEELDRNGTWVYERPYGNVWVPNISYDDWRPYLYGRWLWYPVIGWTWVSSESWGWSVYHYGRWHWRIGLGWYWIPRHSWGPAWVHWWWDNDYIGWCPLGWYNYPVVLVDNHFYNRYYDPYFPAHNRAMSVVRRDHLQSPDLGRRQIGVIERDHLGKLSLKGEQPSVRPAGDNAKPYAIAAKRALAVRPGSRSAVKDVPSAGSVSSSRLRPGAGSTGARAGGKEALSSEKDRGSLSRPAVRDTGSGGRVVRDYPSQGSSEGRAGSGASGNRRASVAEPVRRTGSEAKDTTSRVAPSQKQGGSSPNSEAKADNSKSKQNEGGAKSAVIKKGETIKNYPSSSRSESPTYAPRSASSSRAVRSGSSPSVANYASRASEPAARSSRTASAYSSPSKRPTGFASRSSASSAASDRARVSGPSSSKASPSSSSRRTSGSYSASRPSASRPSSSARPSSSSYSRPSPSRSPSSSSPRSSYSTPSRSGGSSGRSSGVTRSSGSSSGRSSSSSSSRSSSSSSKSGSVKRKG